MRTCTWVCLTFLAISLVADRTAAQPWVAKMVDRHEHNFGVVARGSDTVHRFTIKNIFKQDIELVNVRSSCGCTTPSLEGKLLKTGEIGYVVAKFNTRTFTGMHGATLTLEVAWTDNGVRRRGETQLRVNGNIRGDVVFQPGAVKFENIDQGVPAEQQVQVTYQGRGDWRIVDVRGASDHLEVELTEKQRYSGRVAYDLLVRLKDSAAAGYFNEQLVLVTNDDQNPRIPVDVVGRIVPQLSVAPESVMLGDVVRGTEVSRKVIVRGKQPFRITSVQSDMPCFRFQTDEESNTRHIVEIIFDATCEVGRIRETIRIATDLGETFQATLTAHATVVPNEAESTARENGAADGATSSTTSPDRVAIQ